MTTVYVLRSIGSDVGISDLMEGAFLQIEDAKLYARGEMRADTSERDYFIEEWVGGAHLSTMFVRESDEASGSCDKAVVKPSTLVTQDDVDALRVALDYAYERFDHYEAYKGYNPQTLGAKWRDFTNAMSAAESLIAKLTDQVVEQRSATVEERLASLEKRVGGWVGIA